MERRSSTLGGSPAFRGSLCSLDSRRRLSLHALPGSLCSLDGRMRPSLREHFSYIGFLSEMLAMVQVSPVWCRVIQTSSCLMIGFLVSVLCGPGSWTGMAPALESPKEEPLVISTLE